MPKPYRKNPRKITQKQLENLETTLAELGDLSGIVHDLGTDEIVGGNQRSKVFRLDECEIVLTEEYAQPDEQGTVGLGFVVWRGNRYAYRAVRWDERTAEKANIVANRAGGEWDFEMLAENFATQDLVEWGFEPGEVEAELGFGEDLPDFSSDGSLLSLLNITIDEPRHAVESGDVWSVGPHVLIVAEVVTEWHLWSKYLTGENVIFAPYPGPFVPMTIKADNASRVVMVQPDKYIAGHILDHYEEINGADTVVKND